MSYKNPFSLRRLYPKLNESGNETSGRRNINPGRSNTPCDRHNRAFRDQCCLGQSMDIYNFGGGVFCGWNWASSEHKDHRGTCGPPAMIQKKRHELGFFPKILYIIALIKISKNLKPLPINPRRSANFPFC